MGRSIQGKTVRLALVGADWDNSSDEGTADMEEL
jgi:hypothetical protein